MRVIGCEREIRNYLSTSDAEDAFLPLSAGSGADGSVLYGALTVPCEVPKAPCQHGAGPGSHLYSAGAPLQKGKPMSVSYCRLAGCRP